MIDAQLAQHLESVPVFMLLLSSSLLTRSRASSARSLTRAPGARVGSSVRCTRTPPCFVFAWRSRVRRCAPADSGRRPPARRRLIVASPPVISAITSSPLQPRSSRSPAGEDCREHCAAPRRVARQDGEKAPARAEDGMESETARRAARGTSARVDRSDIEILFQPQGLPPRIIFFESLARWQHPQYCDSRGDAFQRRRAIRLSRQLLACSRGALAAAAAAGPLVRLRPRSHQRGDISGLVADNS